MKQSITLSNGFLKLKIQSRKELALLAADILKN